MSPSAPAARPPRPARILIVDDEASIREGLQELIKTALGLDVDVASNATQALAKAEQVGRYDLVVSDQRMPGMQGLELLALLRKRKRCGSCALMSAFYKEYLDLGAKPDEVRFFAKPLAMDEFLGFISSTVAGA